MDNNVKNSKMKIFGMLDIFVRYEAMNFSTYSASPIGNEGNLFLCISFIPVSYTHLTLPTKRIV